MFPIFPYYAPTYFQPILFDPQLQNFSQIPSAVSPTGSTIIKEERNSEINDEN